MIWADLYRWVSSIFRRIKLEIGVWMIGFKKIVTPVEGFSMYLFWLYIRIIFMELLQMRMLTQQSYLFIFLSNLLCIINTNNQNGNKEIWYVIDNWSTHKINDVK